MLCRRFPELVVYVHERGAPHLVDPSKLLESAGRLYGERMEELWGEVAPVPEERIRVLEGGEEIEGMKVAYTPGHAHHHVCFFDEETGDAYVGDMAGVRLPPYEHTLALMARHRHAIPFADMVSHRFPVAQAPQAMEVALDADASAKVLIAP